MPNKQIQSLTVDGVTYDIVDNTSGYINAQYIENKTDYEIPVSRVGEIVVGETAIGTDSTNFPTSKAVVDYVDERVVQEIDAIDVGITKIKANGTNLPINNGVVNIPVVGPNQAVGLMTNEYMEDIFDSIPHNTSDLDNDSGFITSETDPTVPAWAKASTKPTYTANEVGALPSDTVITDEKLKVSQISDNGTYYPILTSNSAEAQTKLRYSGLDFVLTDGRANLNIGSTTVSAPKMGRLSLTKSTFYTTIEPSNNGHSNTITLPNKTGTVALLDDIPTVPTNISSFTNDAGYITSYTETDPTVPSWAKASSKPSYGLTEISGTDDLRAIEGLAGTSGLLKKTAANTWTLDTNTYLTSYTETDPTVPSWAKQSSKPTYTAAEVGALPDTTTIPSKTSDLMNDSGFITGYTETDPIFSASAASGITASDISNWNGKIDNEYIGYLYSSNLYIPKNWTYERDGEIRTYGIPFYVKDNNATVFSSGKVRIIDTTTDLFSFGTIVLDGETKTGNVQLSATKMYIYIRLGSTSYIYTMANLSDIPDTSSFLTSETDPVFSASAAAGITSTDISNWNAKVSDTGKWNGVSLSKDSTITQTSPIYVPYLIQTSSSSAALLLVISDTTGVSAANKIPKYNNSGYLVSTTPSANDNSTKVATTAYVDAAIPKVYSSTNTGGYLTMATLPIYDGTVV